MYRESEYQIVNSTFPRKKMCEIKVYFLKKGKDICTTKREMNISGKE
ncbi:hypothetical protein BAXH7_03988 [Bacillus amyloliquefaciens XH7]|nr:hypothetical protein BAXH7_03988 [Bacillus amyloliquefaciens XH7]KYC98757.1 hypothetical protein B425_3220 [Bacillus amyloliquefaciens]QBG58331.1 hypothetical protein D2M30_4032 [Bacillus amyloliquefaciens]